MTKVYWQEIAAGKKWNQKVSSKTIPSNLLYNGLYHTMEGSTLQVAVATFRMGTEQTMCRAICSRSFKRTRQQTTYSSVQLHGTEVAGRQMNSLSSTDVGSQKRGYVE